MITKIENISPGMRNLEVEGVISEKSASRFVQTRFGDAAVSTAILKDETGSIILNLWRDQIEQVKEGDTMTVDLGAGLIVTGSGSKIRITAFPSFMQGIVEEGGWMPYLVKRYGSGAS